jgi:hypothetical protein
MEQTFEFNQGKLPLRFQPGGICKVLSACWIRLMREEKDTGEAHRKQELIRAVGTYGPIMQHTYEVNWSTFEKTREKDAFVMRMVAKGRIVAPSHQTATRQWNCGLPPGTALVDLMKDKRRTGFNFAIGGPWGGHSLAFWRSGHQGLLPSGHIYFFDPNYGEFKGDKGEATNWLRKFLTTHYGRINWSYLLEIQELT